MITSLRHNLIYWMLLACVCLTSVVVLALQPKPLRIVVINDMARASLPNTGRVTLVETPIHLEMNDRHADRLVIVAPAVLSAAERVGVSLKSLGYLDAIPGGRQQVHAPVANITRLIGAHLDVRDTADADGVTASCVTFEISPNTAAEVPYTVNTLSTKGVTEIAYEVEVRIGGDVRCSPQGTLFPFGEQYIVDRLFFTMGALR
jgi:hypothetical protein